MSVGTTFHHAMQALIGRGTIHERLIAACVECHLLALPYQDLPDEVQDKFLEFKKDLTKVAAVDEKIIRATINKMTEEEALEAADKILRIYNIILWEGLFSRHECKVGPLP